MIRWVYLGQLQEKAGAFNFRRVSKGKRKEKQGNNTGRKHRMKSEAKTSQLKAKSPGRLSELGKKQRRGIMKMMGRGEQEGRGEGRRSS